MKNVILGGLVSQAITARQLDDQAVLQYKEDGFLIVRGVFTADELSALDAEAERLYQRSDLIDTDNIRCRWQNQFQTGECRFDCFDPVIDLSPAYERVARSPRMLDLMEQIYGERACLFKDKLIFKPPGAEGYRLHQFRGGRAEMSTMPDCACEPLMN